MRAPGDTLDYSSLTENVMSKKEHKQDKKKGEKPESKKVEAPGEPGKIGGKEYDKELERLHSTD